MKATIECHIVTYDELQRGHQVMLLTKERIAVAELWEADFLIDEFKEELETIGFCLAEVYYSGFGNQGDGCCFDAKVDLEAVCKHLGIEYNPDVDDWTCEIEKDNRYRYVHERTRRIHFCATAPGLLVGEVPKNAEGVGEKIEELRLKLCMDFYAKLEKNRDEELAEEKLLSNLRERRYVFKLDILDKLISQQEGEVVLI